MSYAWDNMMHPIELDHGFEGVGQYCLFLVEIEYECYREDDTIGWVPYGEGDVFHPGGGIKAVPDEHSVDLVEVGFCDEEENHFFAWSKGKFIDAPDPMPLTPEQVKVVLDAAAQYAVDHIGDIEPEPWMDD